MADLKEGVFYTIHGRENGWCWLEIHPHKIMDREQAVLLIESLYRLKEFVPPLSEFEKGKK